LLTEHLRIRKYEFGGDRLLKNSEITVLASKERRISATEKKKFVMT
jgi:hypothetical protein